MGIILSQKMVIINPKTFSLSKLLFFYQTTLIKNGVTNYFEIMISGTKCIHKFCSGYFQKDGHNITFVKFLFENFQNNFNIVILSYKL